VLVICKKIKGLLGLAFFSFENVDYILNEIIISPMASIFYFLFLYKKKNNRRKRKQEKGREK
jgi:hypothetical protein